MKVEAQTQATLNSLDKLIKSKARAVQRALLVNGFDLVRAIKIDLDRQGSRHRLYKKHWSSKPNHTPNSDTGWLSNTVVVSPKRKAGVVEVVIFAKYARRLEFGPLGQRRPFVKPARDAKQARFKARVLKAMRNA